MTDVKNFLTEIDLAIIFLEKIQMCFHQCKVLLPEKIMRKKEIVYAKADHLDIKDINIILEVCAANSLKFKMESTRFNTLILKFYE